MVDAIDQAIANTKLGTSDLTADFDCDSTVTTADLAILSAHLGHGCTTTVDVPNLDLSVLELAGGAPNPFTHETRIRYTVPVASAVRLTVHDVQGRHVATLVTGMQEPGQYSATWDGRDASGVTMRAGVYLVRLEAAGAVRTRKIVLAQ